MKKKNDIKLKLSANRNNSALILTDLFPLHAILFVSCVFFAQVRLLFVDKEAQLCI